jgi:hypothetical protein
MNYILEIDLLWHDSENCCAGYALDSGPVLVWTLVSTFQHTSLVQGIGIKTEFWVWL